MAPAPLGLAGVPSVDEVSDAEAASLCMLGLFAADRKSKLDFAASSISRTRLMRSARAVSANGSARSTGASADGAPAGGFNWSMQHTRRHCGERSVADEEKIAHLLLGQPTGTHGSIGGRVRRSIRLPDCLIGSMCVTCRSGRDALREQSTRKRHPLS